MNKHSKPVPTKPIGEHNAIHIAVRRLMYKIQLRYFIISVTKFSHSFKFFSHSKVGYDLCTPK